MNYLLAIVWVLLIFPRFLIGLGNHMESLPSGLAPSLFMVIFHDLFPLYGCLEVANVIIYVKYIRQTTFINSLADHTLTSGAVV